MEGTDTGHENAEGMASAGVSLTAQLGHISLATAANNFANEEISSIVGTIAANCFRVN